MSNTEYNITSHGKHGHNTHIVTMWVCMVHTAEPYTTLNYAKWFILVY